MKKDSKKKIVIDQLKQAPIIQIACKKAGVSRATYYRWLGEDKKFKQEANTAMLEGEDFITDMSESQLISLIKDRNFSAIQLWLRQHHPKYGNKLEFIGHLKVENEPLTPEQQELIKEALQLAGMGNNKENNQHEPDSTTSK